MLALLLVAAQSFVVSPPPHAIGVVVAAPVTHHHLLVSGAVRSPGIASTLADDTWTASAASSAMVDATGLSRRKRLRQLVTDKELQAVLDHGRTTVIMFGSARCPACRVVLPKFGRLAEKMRDVNFYYIHHSRSTDVTFEMYDVSTLPTALIFDAEGRQVDTLELNLKALSTLREKLLDDGRRALWRRMR